MNQVWKAAGFTVGIAGGVAAACYFLIPAFKETVDEAWAKFRADMSEREEELVAALSSDEATVDKARDTWSGRGNGRHRIDFDDDDLNFV